MFFGGKSLRFCHIYVALCYGHHYIVLLYEPVHEISNNVVCATNKASDQPAHMRSLIRAFASRSSILSLEFLSLKGGCRGSSESYTCQNATFLEITCHGLSILIHGVVSLPGVLACDLYK